jgi:hypothetical protein
MRLIQDEPLNIYLSNEGMFKFCYFPRNQLQNALDDVMNRYYRNIIDATDDSSSDHTFLTVSCIK